jgi:hypothetical protein
MWEGPKKMGQKNKKNGSRPSPSARHKALGEEVPSPRARHKALGEEVPSPSFGS